MRTQILKWAWLLAIPLILPFAMVRGEETSQAGQPIRIVVEDFESYPSQEAFVKQWYNVWHGGKMNQSLEPGIKQSGKFSMKCAYSTTKSADKFYSPICRVSKWDLSGTNAIQFWLKPDGSGRELTFQLNIANSTGKNIHDLWEYAYRPVKGDTSARIVTIPYAQLEHNTKYKDAPDVSPVFKPEAVIEVALYIGGSGDEPGEGVYYFDDFLAISVK
jgi:mannan endo-1,4-beta-mannosidase